MIRRRITMLAALAALVLAGLAAGLTLAPDALAWSPSDLPAGWSVSHNVSVGATSCPESYTIFGPVTAGVRLVSPAFCTDSPTYQQDFDVWVNSNYTAPSTSTTTPAATTTVVLTTTATTPAATTTAATSTDAAPAPAPASSTTTNVVTVVTTATPVEQSLQAQIDALSAQLATLTDRVTRIEKAGDAAWLAFEQAISSGSDTATAAETARGTWLNAVYGLGAFAP